MHIAQMHLLSHEHLQKDTLYWIAAAMPQQILVPLFGPDRLARFLGVDEMCIQAKNRLMVKPRVLLTLL